MLADGFDPLPEFHAAYPDADPRELERMIQQARATRRAGTPPFLLRHLRALELGRRDADAARQSLGAGDRD